MKDGGHVLDFVLDHVVELAAVPVYCERYLIVVVGYVAADDA